METGPLCKLDVQRVVGIHLGMYLPKTPVEGISLSALANNPESLEEGRNQQDTKHSELESCKDDEEKSEILRSIKEEDEEDDETLVDINEVKPKGEL